ncbi:MAG: hypothetical protein E6G97_14490 [Alphaproteobacteria bacterium]|nr:MAG: hypothetical protein E6G97_14490 [Alphaproteobacteria bacterium]
MDIDTCCPTNGQSRTAVDLCSTKPHAPFREGCIQNLVRREAGFESDVSTEAYMHAVHDPTS